MISIFLIIGIAILASVSSFLVTGGKLFDKNQNGLKKVTTQGWRVVLGLGIIILSVLQYRQNEISLSNKEAEANKKQDQRDTRLKIDYDSSLIEMKKKFDTTSTKTLLTVTETLGKYGFLLDSSNQKLIKIIRDSSKTKIILPADPVLMLCSGNGISLINHKDTIYTFSLDLCSQDASSTNFDLKSTTVLSDSSGKFTYLGIDNPISKETQISKDLSFRTYFDLHYGLPYKYLYLLLEGTYCNLDKTKKYEISNLYYFNLQGNTFGGVGGKTKKAVVDFMKHFN